RQRDGRGGVAVLGDRPRDEGRQEGVTGEVTGTANAVHDAGAGDVRGVHVAVDIRLDHAVGGNQARAAHNLWVVRDLLRAQDDGLAVLLSLCVHLLQIGRS